VTSAPATSPRFARLLAAVGPSFELDLRSLALFRIAIGVTLLVDLAIRATNLEVHYTNRGVVPLDLLIELGPRTAAYSLHGLVDSKLYVEALFALHACAAIALIVGFKTRVASVVCWMLLASLHARNHLVHMSGDRLMMMWLFWTFFLPVGARMSIDCGSMALRGSARYLSGAGAVILLQLVILYWGTVTAKSDPLWWNGGAIDIALQLRQHAVPTGTWLQRHRELTTLLTWATLAIESFGPLLLFVPRFREAARMLAVVMFVGFHASLALFMSIGLYPLFSILGWLAVIPTGFWDRLAPSAGKAPPEEMERRFAFPRLSSALALGCFGLAAWGMIGIRVSALAAPAPVEFATKALRIDQNWNQFGPRPPEQSLLTVAHGVLPGGEKVSIDISGNQWVHYFSHMLGLANTEFRDRLLPELARALCSDRFESVRVVIKVHRLHPGVSERLPDVEVVASRCVGVRR